MTYHLDKGCWYIWHFEDEAGDLVHCTSDDKVKVYYLHSKGGFVSNNPFTTSYLIEKISKDKADMLMSLYRTS